MKLKLRQHTRRMLKKGVRLPFGDRHPVRLPERQLVPTHPQSNDFYLVEFPKSGVTWLSSLLANAALHASGRPEVATFASLGLYIPDIHHCRDIAAPAYTHPPVRFIKSHASYAYRYRYMIYLARHPLAVMKSYYKFLHQLGAPTGSFESFCRSEVHGIPAWRHHVSSWLSDDYPAQRLHLIRYEDLMEDAAAQLEAVSENMGWNISKSSIEFAVEASHASRMKASEQRYRAHNPRYSMEFVRGKQDIETPQAVIDYINDSCKRELKLLNY